ncbi:cyclic AMP-dependent transcription factor ATF-7-like isoform X2 [Rhodnius prolixus]|uniref:cyclic AMP-dependent transcription factor ATF-7-like isoform X2 n=1 Tax=Rhodnius prolixus TaxID=13249 RepID=UPI003D18885C
MEDGHFLCTEKDGNLMHKKRHEMVLSLNKTNLPSSDQTPTPVRFIRQCEEIGLFQDLQNVNPFEETFRKAAEAVKKGIVPKQSSVSLINHAPSEDLHTPHIFPDINVEESDIQGNSIRTKSNSEKEEEVVVRTEADTSLKTVIGQKQHLSPPVSNDRVSTTFTTVEPKTRDRVTRLDSSTTSEDTKRLTTMTTFTATNVLTDSTLSMTTDPVQVLLRMPNGSLVQLATKPVTNTIVPANIAPASLQLEESVKLLPRTSPNGGTVILATNLQKTAEPKLNSLTTNDVKQKLKQHLGSTSKITKHSISVLKSSQVTDKTDSNLLKKNNKSDEDVNMDETEKEKRRKILERNRKAAIRCRERRKRWVEELRKRADNMAITNKALNEEIRCLKMEVANLRTLLLAHANCPVTLAQSSSHGDPCLSNDRSGEVVSKRARRDCLTLDIERAASVPTIELDTPTPTIVRSDKVLSSVAPPATPEQDRLVTFTEILAQERTNEISEEMIEERHLTTSASLSGGTTTVIQINPNAVRPTTHGFS